MLTLTSKQNAASYASIHVFKQPPMQDYLQPKNALALVERLDDYWRSKGYTTQRFWVVAERDPTQAKGMISVIRNNLVNGLPPVL